MLFEDLACLGIQWLTISGGEPTVQGLRTPLIILLMISLCLFTSCNASNSTDCGDWNCLKNVVEFPRNDGDVTMDHICSEDQTDFVNHESAHGTLTTQSNDNALTPLIKGEISIASVLLDYVQQEPSVEFFRYFVDADLEPINFAIRELQQTKNGYSFFLELEDKYPTALAVEVGLTLSCDGKIKTVKAVTYIYWCALDDTSNKELTQENWVSSGDDCWSCDWGWCA